MHPARERRLDGQHASLHIFSVASGTMLKNVDRGENISESLYDVIVLADSAWYGMRGWSPSCPI